MAGQLYQGTIPIIERDLNEGWLAQPTPVRGGAVERDYDEDPVEMGASPAEMELIDPSNYDAAYEESEATKSSMLHLFLRGGKAAFRNLDQNGDGYCWAYSDAQANMLVNLDQGLPVLRYNPHATAAIIKRGRDEGGWCGLSHKFGRDVGWALEGTGPGQWPLHSRNLKYDTPELREQMKLHRSVEDYYDLGKREYDQTLTRRQLMTLGLTGVPGAVDYNRFSHSMCFVCVVRIEAGSWGVVVLNSWKDWGYYGLGVLREMWPDNAVAVRSTTPSVT